MVIQGFYMNSPDVYGSYVIQGPDTVISIEPHARY